MLEKNKIEKILKLPGEVRGDVLKTEWDYIRDVEGEKGLEIIREEIKRLNIDIDYNSITKTWWYPIGYKVFILELCRDILNWRDSDIVEMGESAYRQSFIVKTVLRYFTTLEKTFQETPKFWEKYWNAGKLIPYRIDTHKKYLIIRLEDLHVHPDLCLYFMGHFKAIANLLIKSDSIEIKERKCPFKGDSIHEYVIKWQ